MPHRWYINDRFDYFTNATPFAKSGRSRTSRASHGLTSTWHSLYPFSLPGTSIHFHSKYNLPLPRDLSSRPSSPSYKPRHEQSYPQTPPPRPTQSLYARNVFPDTKFPLKTSKKQSTSSDNKSSCLDNTMRFWSVSSAVCQEPSSDRGRSFYRREHSDAKPAPDNCTCGQANGRETGVSSSDGSKTSAYSMHNDSHLLRSQGIMPRRQHTHTDCLPRSQNP